MEKIGGTEIRSVNQGDYPRLMTSPYDNGDSFTSLLEMPSDQAMELLHSAENGGDVLTRHRISACHHAPYTLPSQQEMEVIQSAVNGGDVCTRHQISACSHALYTLPSDKALIERAAKYSVFAAEVKPEPLNLVEVKPEPYDNGSNVESTAVSECENSLKRKEREKKGKNSSKKSKTTPNQSSDDGEKLPYVHVRARRGQATDSHSLAERARREKINARMKLLQELVPGCNKISGTALVLDEIINHVQSLQRQVEYLSMRLAAANLTFDSNLDSLFSAGTESMVDYNYNLTNMAMPLMLPDLHLNGDRQQFQQQSDFGSLTRPMWIKEENHHYLATSENSLVSYDSSANSASLHSSQLKMEL